MNAHTIIATAIANIKAMDNNYWLATLQQRLSGGAGSIVSGFATPEDLETGLLAAGWEEYSHPDLMQGTQAFLTRDITGTEGVVALGDLPEDTWLTLDDRKGTGKVSCTVAGLAGKPVDFTVLIVGKENDKNVVFTFHPGAPVPPSKVEARPGLHGTKVLVGDAIDMGLTTAKVV